MLPGRYPTPGSPTPSALLSFPQAAVSAPAPRTPASRLFHHVVIHAASSSQILGVPGAAAAHPLHVCMCLCPLCLPLWFPLSSLPNQSTVAEDRTACPGHSLEGWGKARGIRRGWEASQPRRAGRGEPPPAPWMPTLLPPPLPGHLGRMLPCGAAISLPNWRNAPLSLLQFRSACSEQMITEMEHMGPKVTGHSGKVTLVPGLGGRGRGLWSTASPFVLHKGTGRLS